MLSTIFGDNPNAQEAGDAIRKDGLTMKTATQLSSAVGGGALNVIANSEMNGEMAGAGGMLKKSLSKKIVSESDSLIKNIIKDNPLHNTPHASKSLPNLTGKSYDDGIKTLGENGFTQQKGTPKYEKWGHDDGSVIWRNKDTGNISRIAPKLSGKGYSNRYDQNGNEIPYISNPIERINTHNTGESFK